MEHRPLSTAEFDRFAAVLDYPLFVVTTTDGTEVSGCLVGFATQVSIDPPRLLVCLSEQNHTLRVALGAELVAVHVLGDDRRDLAAVFGGETGDETDKFAEVRSRPGPGGVPILEECRAHVVGRVLDHWPLGDHVGFLLEPVDAADADRPGGSDALLSLEDVDDLEPGHPA